VAEERRIATEVLEQYQKKGHARGKVTIEVIAWDDLHAPTPVEAGVTPQESVTRFKGRPAECDLTIVILWGRLGTQLPPNIVRVDGSRYESGTVWEYEDAKQAGKPIWVYRHTDKPRIDVDDPEFEAKRQQYQAIKDFITKLKNPDGSLNGGVNDYKTTKDFQDDLGKHLELFVRDRLEAQDSANGARPTTRHTTIPQGGTKFIGREREQKELREWVLNHWLVTVTGAPGIGKSRLAMQVALSLEDEFVDVVTVELTQLTEPGAVQHRIATRLGIKGQGERDLVDLIGEFLKPRGKLLLILDNCETVLRECQEVVGRLHELCGELHLLLTTRVEFGATTGMGIDYIYRVPPLELPDPEHLPDLKALAKIDSVELLLECLKARAVPTELTEENAKKVAQLCCCLAGFPLALELVAAQMKTLHLDTLLTRWTEKPNSPRSGKDGATQEEGVILHNAIRSSYELLGEEPNGERVQALFKSLSVFRRGWLIEAARLVCGEPDDTDENIRTLMEPLIRASLVQIEDLSDEYRFSYLDPIRHFAWVQLKSEDRTNDVETRHVRWATEFAERLQPKLLTNEQASALSKLIQETGNLRAAFHWALERKDAENALRLTSALWRLMEIKGLYQDGATRLQNALKLRGAKKFPLLCSKALSGLSILAYRQGNLDMTERCSKQSYALERKYGTDPTGMANALSDLGLVAMRRGQYKKALGLYTRALKIHQTKKDERYLAVCLFNIGALYLSMGKLDKAETKVAASLKKFENTGNLREAAFALNTLALIERYGGDYDAASHHADRSLAIRQDLGDTGGMADTMVTKADILIRKRHFDAALDLLVKSGNIYLQTNNERGITEALEQLASLAADQEFHTKAVTLYAAAEEVRKKLCIPLPPVAQQARDARIESIRQALGKTRFDTQWEKGRVTTPGEAFALGVDSASTP